MLMTICNLRPSCRCPVNLWTGLKGSAIAQKHDQDNPVIIQIHNAQVLQQFGIKDS